MNVRITRGCLILLLVYLLLAGSRPPSVAAQAPGLTTPEELETFVDGLIAAQMEAYQIAGVTVSVVRDGELFFAKGYGFADVEQGRPVTPEETLFRVGSVSKMFVWTAVMQLVEQGLLDLDADVETYLDFELPDDSLGPVTLRHLLTHTPGFEDKALGLFSHDPADLRPPGEVLAQAGIKQVYPPGQISAYSNYGAGLAGYVVERVSGMPFEAYVEQNIFLPLGMEHSTFRQPLPEALAVDMSVGYLFKNGQFAPQPFEIVQPAPAGSLSSTAVDMAAFMIALLQEGELDGERILQSETVQAMRSPQFQHAAGLDAWGYGFALSQIPEGGSFGHGGDTIYFHTEMTLLPQHGVGVFISTNTDTGSLARFDFMTAFLERYYGAKGFTAADPAGQGDPASLAAYAGTYYSARSNYTGLERILNLLQPLEVSVSPDGRLLVQGQFTAWPVAFVEQEPGRFLAADEGLPDRSPLVFAPAEEGGPVRYAYWNQLAFIKQPWYAQTGFMFLVLGVSLAGMVAALIGLPAGAWSRRVYARRLPPEERAPLSIPEGLMRWVAWTLALLVVLFYLAFMLFTADVNALLFGFPPGLQAALALPWIIAALTAVLIVLVITAWVRRWGTAASRIGFTLLALLAAAQVWFLAYWNLLQGL